MSPPRSRPSSDPPGEPEPRLSGAEGPAPGDRVAGRFRIQRALGAGGMGSVHLAEDDWRDGRLVALKSAPLSDVQAREGLEHEFALLARLRHPNVVGVHDFGRCDESRRAWFSMELAEGRPLLEALEGRPFVERAEVVAQLCRAIDFLHSRGLVHCDLKSDNVLVRERGNGRLQATLVDLGLAADPDELERRAAGRFSGTLSHAAPELVGGAGQAGPASDLYSLGVLLFELHAGRPPFVESDPVALAEAHRGGEIPDLASACPELAPPARALLGQLLAKDPAARPPSALPVARAWAEQAGDAVEAEELDSLLAHVRSPRLIGQDEGLERTLALVDVAADRRSDGARALGLAGPPGSGKSRLLDEAARRAQLSGLSVLVGRGGGTGDLHAGLAEPIREAARLSGERAAPLLPELVKISSALARETGVLPSAPLEAADELLRLGSAVWDVLVAAAHRPVLLIVDDTAQLSAETEELLGYLLRRLALARDEGDRAPIAALLAGTEGEDGGALGAELAEHGGIVRTRWLDEAGTGELVDALWPRLEGRDELAAIFQRELGGNAALVERWAASLVREGALRRGAGGWSVELDHSALRKPPKGLAEAVGRQIEALSEEARELLADASLLPDGISATELASLGGREADAQRERLDELEALDLVVTSIREGGRRVAIASGLVREAMDAGWAELRAQRAARLREEIGDGSERLSAEAIASLSQAAGSRELAVADWQRALDLGRERGDRARSLAAAKQLALASEGDRRRRALCDAADAALHLERIQEASELLEQVGDAAFERREDELALLRVQADTFHRQGLLKDAEQAANRRLELLPSDSPDRWDAVTQLLLCRARDSSRDWEEQAALLRTLSEGHAEREAEYHMQVAVAQLARYKTDEASASLREALKRGLTPARQAAAHNNLGVAALRAGRFEDAARAFRKAIEIRRELGARVALSGTLVNLSLLDIESARPAAAVKRLREALSIKREAGDRPGLLLCITNLAVAEFQREDFGAVLEICASVRAQESRVQAGRAGAVLDLLEAEIRARLGDVEGARSMLARLEGVEKDEGFAPHQPQLHVVRVRLEAITGGSGPELERLRALAASPELTFNDRMDLGSQVADIDLRAEAARRAPFEPPRVDAALARRVLAELRSRARLPEGRSVPPPLLLASHLSQAAALDALGDQRGVKRQLAAAAKLSRKASDKLLPLELDAAQGLAAARAGDLAEAERCYESALGRLRRFLRRVPVEHRDRYLALPEQAALRAALLAVRKARREQREAGGFFAPLGESAAKAAPAEARALRSELTERKKDGARLREVIEITRDINALVPVDELLDRILDRVLSLMHAERGFIVLAEEGGGTRFAAARDRSGRRVERAEFAVSRSVLDEVVRTGEPVLSSDARADSRFVSKQSVLLLDLRSVLVAPLVAREQVLGAIYLDNSQRSGAFGERDRDLLTLFAGQAAVAVENARLHETRIAKDLLDQELRIARGIQEKLIPESLPSVAGWRLAASMRPARELGGDYYDCLELEGGRLRLAIGDVSGKGIPAGLVMVMAHSILRSEGFAEEGLDRILERANAALEARIEDDKFMTLLLLQPEPCGRAVRLALAGHEPPLLYRKRDGSVKLLDSGGLALGMLADLSGRLREDRVELEPGDLLCCYTDGVTECRSPDGSLFGRERLAEAVAAGASGGAAGVRAFVERELDAHRAGAERSDDVTLLVLEAGDEGG